MWEKINQSALFHLNIPGTKENPSNYRNGSFDHPLTH